MLFNSLDFLFFFPIVVIFYFLLPFKFRWVLLLFASYYFYMCWKVEYIILIVMSTVIDYFVSIKMGKIPEKAERRKWLYLSLITNLGILFGFKYFTFFGDSVQLAFNQFNIFYDFPKLNVLLPVGISFYTFQTLSYSIDVYNGKIQPEKHLGIFALYVTFFPQLVAGPIERPDRLIPQLKEKYNFDYKRVVTGLKMMLWGFFLKLVIADRLAPIVDVVYSNPQEMYGFQVILGTFFFSFQIFCDFAGYSIIARGAAWVMGYDLIENFRRPYLAKSIREFWQRWHISLSTWFRDYVYIPLGGNRVVKWRWYYNLFITFLVSGLWHGANWTFVWWGALHGFYLIFAIIFFKIANKIKSIIGLNKISIFKNAYEIFSTFVLVAFAWIFFRANNLEDAFTLIRNIFKISFAQLDIDILPTVPFYKLGLAFIFIFFMKFIHFLEEHYNANPLFSEKLLVRWVTYIVIILMLIGFGVFTSNDFIYFQF